MMLNLFVNPKILICDTFIWDTLLLKESMLWKHIIPVPMLIKILFVIFVIKLNKESCLSSIGHFGLTVYWYLGPCSTTSMHGPRYFFNIFDDHTCYTWISLMNNRSETWNIIKDFITQMKPISTTCQYCLYW